MNISTNCVLIQNNKHSRTQTEKKILNDLYEKIVSKNFKYDKNNFLPHIMQYLNDFNENEDESFCRSKRSKKTGMRTGYLIDSLSSQNSAIVCLVGDDVLGVLTFNYIESPDIDHAYGNSLYIDAFCTNQQNRIPGIGTLLLQSIIEATTELGVIANIYLKAGTEDSERFYKKFNFKDTGKKDDDGMKVYIYSILTGPEKTVKNKSHGGKRTFKYKKTNKRKLLDIIKLKKRHITYRKRIIYKLKH